MEKQEEDRGGAASNDGPSQVAGFPGWVLQKISREFPVIRQAPVSILGLTLVFTFVVVMALSWFQLLVPAFYVSSKQAQIDALEAQVKSLGAAATNQSTLDGVWLGLSSIEQNKLAKRALEIEPFHLIIACGNISCRALTQSLLQSFRDAGWKSVRSSVGGIYEVGMEGLVIYPADDKARMIRDVIESSTGIKVTLYEQLRTANDSPEVFLSVGQKPLE